VEQHAAAWCSLPMPTRPNWSDSCQHPPHRWHPQPQLQSVKVAVWATAVAMPVGTVEVVTSAVLVGTLEVGILTMLTMVVMTMLTMVVMTMLTMVVMTMLARLTPQMKMLKTLKKEIGVVVMLTVVASAFHFGPAWPLTCGRQSLPAEATRRQRCRW
jgi:hypothetical protein